MKKLSSAGQDVAMLAKAARHRQYFWCRLWNGFLDDPMLRVVAGMTTLPLYQVQAFVTKLDSFANQADPRGYVGDFSPALFGAAMGMPAEQAATLYAALEHPDVRWIDQEHVAAFWSRNRDKEDTNNTLRKQRSRARQDVRKELSKRARLGHISDDQRDGVEAILELIEDRELLDLRAKLRMGVALEPSLKVALSTCHASHIVTVRDIVTVTPRADHTFIEGAVDNSGEATRGTAQGLPEEQIAPDDAQSTEAELWLGSEAIRIVVERMDVPRPRAETLIARWRRDLQDDPVATATIIRGCDDSPLLTTSARFHIAVTDHIRRCAQARLKGEPLPLPPVRNFGTDPLGKPTGHNVTVPAVDKPAAAESSVAPPRSGTDG